jgi:Mat/Ecp fimbriae major subunit
MTKKFYSAVAAGTALVAVTIGATSANAATATANATANIVQAITITETSDLDFATIVPGAAASTVAVSSAGVRNCGAGLTCSGTHSAGAFSVTGTASMPVVYGVDASTSLTSGANSMTLTGLTLSAAGGTLSVGGTATFSVGGTLNVGANQAAGVYNGTYNVSANYN